MWEKFKELSESSRRRKCHIKLNGKGECDVCDECDPGKTGVKRVC